MGLMDVFVCHTSPAFESCTRVQPRDADGLLRDGQPHTHTLELSTLQSLWRIPTAAVRLTRVRSTLLPPAQNEIDLPNYRGEVGGLPKMQISRRYHIHS